MLRWDQPADHTLPPHEVKLYALDMARTIHEWADLQDICAIVEAKSKVPGLLLNKVRLREAVCDELDARQCQLQEKYRKARTRQQRLIEQASRECAAEARRRTAVSQRAAAAREILPVSGTAMRKRKRDDTEELLRETKKQICNLQERGEPPKPSGSMPRRMSKRGPWKDRKRAYDRYQQQLRKLTQQRDALRKELDRIGMSRATFRHMVDQYLPPPPGARAIVPTRVPLTGASKPYRVDATYADTVYERGREEAAQESERIRLRVSDECESTGVHPALAVYCGLPELHPLAYYHDSHHRDVMTLKHTRQLVERLVSAHTQDQGPGRTQPQSVQTERNQMIANTDRDGEDYLLWGRTQRQRLEHLQRYEAERLRVHTEKQLKWRGQRQVDLENAAERLQSQELRTGSKPWRVLRQLILRGPHTLVVPESYAARMASALSDRYAVLIWIPDDDPRPCRSHDANVNWHLERDVLDFMYPQANGSPRSPKTQGCRHRGALKQLMNKEIQSWPVAVIIAASTPVTTVHYRAMMSLQKDCGLTIIVCDPAVAKIEEAGGLEMYAKSQGAKSRKSAGRKRQRAALADARQSKQVRL